MSEHDPIPNKPADDETPVDEPTAEIDGSIDAPADSNETTIKSPEASHTTADELAESEGDEPATVISDGVAVQDEEIADDEPATEEVNDEESLDVDVTRESVDLVDDFDVVGALAAVTELDSLVDEDDSADVEDYDELSPSDTIEPYQVVGGTPETDFQQPPFLTLERGQLASIVPAFILIGIGAWLTITLTTTDATLSPILVISTLMLVLGFILITRGITSGRWDRGSLFLGLMTAFSGGLLLATDATIIPDTPLTITNSYPFYVSATGAALLLTAILGRQTPRYVALFGLALIIGGGAGYALLNNLLTINVDLQPIVNTAVPVLLAVVAVVMIIPLIIRRRE